MLWSLSQRYLLANSKIAYGVLKFPWDISLRFIEFYGGKKTKTSDSTDPLTKKKDFYNTNKLMCCKLYFLHVEFKTFHVVLGPKGKALTFKHCITSAYVNW